MHPAERFLSDEMAMAPGRDLAVLHAPDLKPEALWRVIADTDLLNRAIGSPEIEVCNVPVRSGVAKRLFTTRDAQRLTYEEEHYQWEEGRWLGGRRFFLEGPLERFVFLFSISPDGAGARAELNVAFWSRTAGDEAIAAEVARGLGVALRGLQAQIAEAHRLPRPSLPRPAVEASRLDAVQLRVLAAALTDSGEDPAVVADLVKHLETATDPEVGHMAPLELARAWDREEEPTVDAFIRGARLGLLQPQWEVACPSCRGPKGTTSDVVALATGPVHCADCNLSFDADPTSNMALTFSPSPEIRRVEERFACIGAPTRTPHVKAQIYLHPGATTRLGPAEGAELRVCCPETGSSRCLPGPGPCPLSDDGRVACRVHADGSVEVTNATEEPVRVRLEDPTVPDTFLRARDVLERPRFRALFGADEWEFVSAMERAWRAGFGLPEARVSRDASELRYDLVVVGAGPGGEAAAVRAAQLGRRVALVEANPQFGGPSGLASKAMREAVHQILGWARAANPEPAGMDAARRHARLRALFEKRYPLLRRYVAALQMQDVIERMTRVGVHLHHGRARLVSGDEVVVCGPDGEEHRLRADRIVLATGSRPARPPDVPFDGSRVLDATDMGCLERLPATLCIAGAGVIGCEFATMMAALGVQVTLLTGGRAPLAFLDAELAEAGVQQMQSAGVRLLPDRAAAITPRDGGVTIELSGGARAEADLLLHAEGRDANSDDLGCDAAGIAIGRYGQIEVDAERRTACPSVFAIGDLVGAPGLACTAAEQGRQVAERLFAPGEADLRGANYPTTIWTFPELAGVGSTEQQARSEGVDVVAGRARYRDLPRGILSGDLAGWLKLVGDRRTGRLLGVHIVGEGACELVHYGRALVDARTPLDELARSGFSAVTLHGLYRVAAEDALAQVARSAPRDASR